MGSVFHQQGVNLLILENCNELQIDMPEKKSCRYVSSAFLESSPALVDILYLCLISMEFDKIVMRNFFIKRKLEDPCT